MQFIASMVGLCDGAKSKPYFAQFGPILAEALRLANEEGAIGHDYETDELVIGAVTCLSAMAKRGADSYHDVIAQSVPVLQFLLDHTGLLANGGDGSGAAGSGSASRSRRRGARRPDANRGAGGGRQRQSSAAASDLRGGDSAAVHDSALVAMTLALKMAPRAVVPDANSMPEAIALWLDWLPMRSAHYAKTLGVIGGAAAGHGGCQGLEGVASLLVEEPLLLDDLLDVYGFVADWMRCRSEQGLTAAAIVADDPLNKLPDRLRFAVENGTLRPLAGCSIIGIVIGGVMGKRDASRIKESVERREQLNAVYKSIMDSVAAITSTLNDVALDGVNAAAADRIDKWKRLSGLFQRLWSSAQADGASTGAVANGAAPIMEGFPAKA